MIKLEEYMEMSKEKRQMHIDLGDKCIIRGTTSTHCRGILAHYHNTTLNSMKVDCCHACNNPDCSNPKHLYWGTRSENVDDMHKFNPEIRKKYGAKGDKNTNYGVMPWRNNVINSHTSMQSSWKLAQYIYNEYYKNGWDFSKYGQGESYFDKKYNIPRGSCHKMITLFYDNWNPNEDVDYINFTNGN